MIGHDPIFPLADEYRRELVERTVARLADTDTERRRFAEVFQIVYPNGDIREYLNEVRKAFTDDET